MMNLKKQIADEKIFGAIFDSVKDVIKDVLLK